MNRFNRYFQGPESNIINFATKLTAFIRKFNLWIEKTSRTDSLECVLRMWRHLEGNQPSITFVCEITKHLLFKMKSSITSSMMVMHKHALTLGFHSLLSLMIYQWKLANKKNSLICNAMKVHRKV